ncbi:MAG: hypothetical protein DRI54_05105 [Bacteroidetes bacterium]|nr:MAG: hypothetical protein DRI54_05105 [Bacteroidota bacterium]
MIFSIIILRWNYFKFQGLSRWAIIAVFLLKIAAGYLSFKYHNIYFAGGDGSIYLNSGRNLVDYSHKNPLTYFKLFTNQNRNEPGWEETYQQIIYWDPEKGSEFIDDNRTAIRINSLISLLSFRSIGAHIILLIFLSLIGLMALYKIFRKWFENVYPPVIFFAVFLSPSIIFWTSGILKETHTIFILGLFLFQLSIMLDRRNYSSILWTILLGILLLLARTYLSIALIIPVLFLVISSFLKTDSILKSIGLTLAITTAAFILLNVNGVDLFKMLSAKQADFNLIGINANSFFHIAELSQPLDIIKYMPIALINVYLQPQLFSFESWLYIFPIIENIDLITMIIFAFIYYKSPNKKETKYLIFVLLIWIIGGWIIGLTVPIQGAIARYKSVLIPFLLMSVIAIADWDRLKTKYLKEE